MEWMCSKWISMIDWLNQIGFGARAGAIIARFSTNNRMHEIIYLWALLLLSASNNSRDKAHIDERQMILCGIYLIVCVPRWNRSRKRRKWNEAQIWADFVSGATFDAINIHTMEYAVCFVHRLRVCDSSSRNCSASMVGRPVYEINARPARWSRQLCMEKSVRCAPRGPELCIYMCYVRHIATLTRSRPTRRTCAALGVVTQSWKSRWSAWQFISKCIVSGLCVSILRKCYVDS